MNLSPAGKGSAEGKRGQRYTSLPEAGTKGTRPGVVPLHRSPLVFVVSDKEKAMMFAERSA